LPIGKMLMDGLFIDVVTGDGTVPNDILTVQNHFGPSCAPRVVTNGFGICDSCPQHCDAPDDFEDYQGFKGAAKCLMDGTGEVAFVEGETIYKFAEQGSDPKGWATGRPEDYRLLCGDGISYVDVNAVGDAPNQNLRAANYFSCNIAKVPAGFLATGSHTTHELFTEAQETLRRAESNSDWRNTYLINNPDGLIFSADTERLFRVNAGTQDYLGESYEYFSTVRDLNEGSLGNIPGTGGGGDTSSDGISEGEAAGLAFAMLGVGCGCTLLGAYGIRKYRISQQGSSMSGSTFSGTLMNDVGGDATKAPDMI